MKGGVTYLDMEKRKDAEFALRRLQIWLRSEAIVHDFLSDAAIRTIRIVLAGTLNPPQSSNPPRIDGLDKASGPGKSSDEGANASSSKEKTDG